MDNISYLKQEMEFIHTLDIQIPWHITTKYIFTLMSDQ